MNCKKMMFLFGLMLMIGSFASAQTYKYIGADKCKMCHNKPATGEQYNKWAAGPHANALKSLEGADRENPKCLKCHSTAASVDQSLVATIKVEEGVSCESCHGPGSIYKSAGIMKNQKLALSKGMIMPTEEVCKKCHNAESPTFKGFNYEEYSKKIAHPNPTLQ
ncbi:cytochrome c family protein [Mangrovibacterium marinum]|uniref:Cytochrome c554/c'-like protein n=1 Tax=Mangrovibacterium marinum TaxID=1639118 RepID=A0A2T5BZL1_9BACT|nr:cytochrome c family protein [Mangrovibacterium marinum]PTN07738.1 cytochrome c554/c'-like protein [Mangrovibacterium marinum]